MVKITGFLYLPSIQNNITFIVFMVVLQANKVERVEQEKISEKEIDSSDEQQRFRT
jgi:large-conductance mechanosensitive channel